MAKFVVSVKQTTVFWSMVEADTPERAEQLVRENFYSHQNDKSGGNVVTARLAYPEELDTYKGDVLKDTTTGKKA